MNDAFAWAKERRRILMAAALLSALVALPFALTASPEFRSDGRVLIPASDVVSTESRQTSALEIRIDGYARSALAGDTRDSLGSHGSGLRSVTALRLKDEDLYLITVSATSASLAREAAEVAADVLLDASDAFAEDQVASLRGEARPQITELTDRLIANEDERRQLATKLAGLKDNLDGLREGPSTQAAVIARLQGKKDKTEAAIETLQSDHAFLTDRREGLQDTVADAERDLLERQSVSVLVAGPTEAQRAAPTRTLVTVAIGVLIGLAVAVLVLLVIERRAPAVEASQR